MVGQVVVGPAGCDGPRPCEGERRERVRVVERGDLGDDPADADARQVRRPVVEFAGERRGVGCEITLRAYLDAGRLEVAREELQALMDRLRLAGRGDLDDDQAMAIAVEEVRAVRASRRSDS